MMCIGCRQANLNLTEQKTDIEAEVKGLPVVVEMHVLVCPNCGYKTIRGEDMSEYMRLAADSYRRKKGLLTSDDIRSRRQSLQMSQEEFAAYIGVGVASIKRWELGKVQDLAMDRLIRITTSFDEALAQIQAILAAKGETTPLSIKKWQGSEAWKPGVSIPAKLPIPNEAIAA